MLALYLMPSALMLAGRVLGWARHLVRLTTWLRGGSFSFSALASGCSQPQSEREAMIYDVSRMRTLIRSVADMADGIITAYTFLWGALGALFTAMAGYAAVRDSGAILGLLIGGALFGAIGRAIGYRAAFRYRLLSESLACLYQIERNTQNAEQREQKNVDSAERKR